jgi:MATE family multidrug resistance protein
MLIAAFFQLFDGAQCTALGILRGLQDLRFPTLITFFAYWVASLPFAYLFGFYYDWKIDGIWYSFVIGLAIAAIANTARFWYLTRT